MIAYRAMLDVPGNWSGARPAAARRAPRARYPEGYAGVDLLVARRCWGWSGSAAEGRSPCSGPGSGSPGRPPTATATRSSTVLAAQAPDLHEALAARWPSRAGRTSSSTASCSVPTAAPRPPSSVKGETINAWYSGKHRALGGNIQAVMRPDGIPIWTSDAAPGHLHDLTVARDTGVIGALYWAAAQLDLPTLADSGYEGAGQGIKTPIKQPADGHASPPTTRPTTRCCARPAASANAASPCSPAAGEPSTRHRQPPPNRRTRPSRTRAHTNRERPPTQFLLRSPHWRKSSAGHRPRPFARRAALAHGRQRECGPSAAARHSWGVFASQVRKCERRMRRQRRRDGEESVRTAYLGYLREQQQRRSWECPRTARRIADLADGRAVVVPYWEVQRFAPDLRHPGERGWDGNSYWRTAAWLRGARRMTELVPAEPVRDGNGQRHRAGVGRR